MLVGPITFGKGFISWPANLPQQSIGMHTLVPDTLLAATRTFPQVLSLPQPNRKTFSEIQNTIAKTCLFLTGYLPTHHWEFPALGTLQTNKDQFELINNNICTLNFVFVIF